MEPSTTELSFADLRELLRIFVDSELRDLQVEVGGVRLHVSKDAGSPQPASMTTASSAVADPVPPTKEEARSGSGPATATEPGLFAVRSPSVGIFYRRPAPDQPSYVELGDTVSASTPICTVEVMKMFTEVPAGCDGTVAEICVENQQLVEHDEVLMYIRPALG